jgi:hypothetical protein
VRDKQVYELTMKDIEQHAVWYFPMDDTVKDELTVRPVVSQQTIDADFQIIVRARYIAQDGVNYLGYVYWSYSPSIENLKPVMFVSQVVCISFWAGIIEPMWSDYAPRLRSVRSVLPVSFSTDVFFDLEPISGHLEGLYYFKSGKIVAVA